MFEVLYLYQTFTDCVIENINIYTEMPGVTAGYRKFYDCIAFFFLEYLYIQWVHNYMTPTVMCQFTF